MSRKNPRSLIGLLLLAVLLVPLLAACGGDALTAVTRTDKAPPMSQSTVAPPALGQPELANGLVAAAPTDTAADASYAYVPSEKRLAEGASSSSGGSDTIHAGVYDNNTYQSTLTAGEVDDNAKFSDYLDFLRQYQGPHVDRLDVSERLYVQVSDGDQKPLAGALVGIYSGQEQVFAGRTTSDGRVAFFPRVAPDAPQQQSYRVVATAAGKSVEGTLQRGAAGLTLALPAAANANDPLALDVVFLLDATGSMSDEIEKIQGTIGSIAGRIDQLPGGTATRFGLVAYRDRGEAYVTRSWDLTPSVAQFAANLAQVQAEAGGDTYESVNAGLHDALALPGWQQGQETRHLRLLFLVGDAAPHLDYADDYSYPALLNQAVAMGVKIFPIGCSGLDDLGEYVFRQFAQFTQGKFVFMTYADGVSGAPGVATTNHVEDFSVGHLDDLLVRLVSEEVALQNAASAVVLPAPAPETVRIFETAPVVSPVNSFIAWLRPLAEGAWQWGWLALLIAVAYLLRRDRQKARVVPAQAAATSAPEPPFSEATRTLSMPGRARVRPSRPRRTAAMTLSRPPTRTAYVQQQGRPTSPLPPRDG